MSRYIDANEMIKVLAFFLDNMGITLFGRSGKDLARSLVFQADNGKDVVEVIRCGECRYWHSGECWGIPYRGDYDTSIDTKADDFCSYGSRSEKPNKSEKPIGSEKPNNSERSNE